MRCKVFGTSLYSLWEISEGLRSLNVSHKIVTRGKPKIVNLKKQQPAKVVLSNDLNNFEVDSVNFIVASVAELSLTNFVRLKGTGIQRDLKTALLSKETIIPEVKTMSAEDYVNWLAKPSLLNKIQTELYRIQPYSLRKQTQALIFDFFNSRISKRALVTALQDSLKCEGLISLATDAMELRDAVTRSHKEGVEKVSEETGFHTFELIYLSKDRVK